MLTVSGHGEVRARPDKATVQFGVEVQAETAAAAQESVNNTMQKVLKQIKELKVPRTSNANERP